MAASTYISRILGYLLLRGRQLGPRAQAVMENVPGCVLISVIAPAFVSDKPANLLAQAVTLLAATRLPFFRLSWWASRQPSCFGMLWSEGSSRPPAQRCRALRAWALPDSVKHTHETAARNWPRAEVEDGRALFEAAPDIHLYNPFGKVHGGFAATMLDFAWDYAVLSKMAPGQKLPMLEIKVAFRKAMTWDEYGAKTRRTRDS